MSQTQVCAFIPLANLLWAFREAGSWEHWKLGSRSHLWVLNLQCKWAEILRSLPLSGDLIQDKEESRQRSTWQLVWAPLYLIKKIPCRHSHLPPEAKLRHVDGRPPAGSRAVALGASSSALGKCHWSIGAITDSALAPHGLCTAEAECETQHWTLQASGTHQKMMGVNHTDLDNSNPPKELVSTTPVLKSGSWRLLFFIQTAAELLFNTKSQNNC